MKLSAQSDSTGRAAVRLIVEAICTTCGPITDADMDGTIAIMLAETHTALTGHIVVLNGTTDLPERTEAVVLQDPTILLQVGEA